MGMNLFLRRAGLMMGSCAVMIGALAACSSTDEDPQAAQRAQAALDAGAELKRQVVAAETTLVERCMARKGFPPYEVGNPVVDTQQNYESPPAESAQLVGYGIDPRRRIVKNDTPKGAGWDRLPDAEKQRYTVAKFGDMDRDVVTYDFGDGQISSPRNGCIGQVRTAVYGDLLEHLRMDWLVTNQLKALRADQLRNDTDLSQSLKQWSSCMASLGHSGLAHPGDARTQAANPYKGVDPNNTVVMDAARDKEIRLAVADAKCADDTSLRATNQQARAKAVAKVLTKHEVDILAWREFMSKALVRAQDLLKQ